MNSRQRVLTALQVGQPDRVPFMEGSIDRGLQVQIMQREDFTPFELADTLGLDALGVDFLPPLFAAKVVLGDREYLTSGMLDSDEDLSLMQFPDPDDPALYTSARRLVDENRGERAIFARIRLGASPLLLSMGLENFSYALVDNPALVEKVFAAFNDWTIRVVSHLRDVGVDFVWNFDDLAYKTGPMISPRTFRKVFMPGLSRVAHAIRATGLPWVFHSDGNLMLILDDLLTLGMDGLHPIEPGAMDIHLLKQQYGRRLCLVGNIDLHHTLTQGRPEEVEREVRDRIDDIGRGGGYIISSANSLTSYCLLPNVLAMRDAIARYGWYSRTDTQPS